MPVRIGSAPQPSTASSTCSRLAAPKPSSIMAPERSTITTRTARAPGSRPSSSSERRHSSEPAKGSTITGPQTWITGEPGS